jgi:hypothetical protein
MFQIAMIAVMGAHSCDLDREEIELRFGILAGPTHSRIGEVSVEWNA